MSIPFTPFIKTIRFTVFFSLLFLLSANCFAQFSYKIEGIVKHKGAALSGADVLITNNAGTEKQLLTNSSGGYSYNLQPNDEYSIVISKPGYTQFQLIYSTMGLSGEVAKKFKGGSKPESELFVLPNDQPTLLKINAILDKPLLSYFYNSETNTIDADQNLEESLTQDLAKVATMTGGQSSTIETNYKTAIAKGDAAFTAAKYDAARTAYNEAVAAKPNEQYPKTKLTDIDKALANSEAKAKADAAEKERLAKEKLLADAAAKEKAEKDKALAATAAKEKAEKDKLLADAAAKEKADKDKAIADAAEKQRLEKEKTLADAAEKARLAKEAALAEKDRIAKEKAIADNVLKEKALADAAEKDRLLKEKLEKDKAIADAAAKEKADKDKAIADAAEKQRLEKEKALADVAEKDRLAKEAALAEKDRIAKEKAIADNVLKEKALADAAEKDRLLKEKLEKDKAIADAAAKEKADKDKAIADAAEKQRLEKEKALADAAEKERLAKEVALAEKDRIAKEKAIADNVLKEKALADAAEKDRLEKERLAKEKAIADAAEKERLEKEKEKADAFAKQKAEQEKAAADLAEKERLAKEEELKLLQVKYDNAIVTGDSAVKVKNYEVAKSAYTTAASLKPKETNPATKIKEVDVLMELEKRSQYTNELAKKYPQGITEEIVKEGNVKITKRIVVQGNKGNLYTKRETGFGATYYFKDDITITEAEFIRNTESIK
jgi:Carboxypeptidase regulatory-like domain